jgi:hypothetical protein
VLVLLRRTFRETFERALGEALHTEAVTLEVRAIVVRLCATLGTALCATLGTAEREGVSLDLILVLNLV